jgi:ATP-dependent RNA helicase RhlE
MTDHHSPTAHHATPTPTAFPMLIEPLRKALHKEGYTHPTPIQAQAIPPLLLGRDLFGTAQTGTGKTAAFLLPVLQLLTQRKRMPGRGRPRCLILAPTRELAAQIGESIHAYGHFLHLTSVVIYGGVGQRPQELALARGMDIVVATPGRLLDLMQQGHASLDRIEIVVLDEADRMMDMGFIRDINKIIAALPRERQSLFFSATMSPEILALARTMVREPVHISITPEQPAVERITQKVMFVEKKDKDTLLLYLLRHTTRAIVFCQMKHVANKVAIKLEGAGIRSSAIHGNKSQAARTEALARFRAGKVKVLVATDIAARGIDVDDIALVVNYDLPNEPETYVHRIGRTARAGASGEAISFCASEERAYLRAIERLLKKPVPVIDDHPFHSEAARHSTMSPPPQGGYGGHGAQQGGQRRDGQRKHGGGQHSGPRRSGGKPSWRR